MVCPEPKQAKASCPGLLQLLVISARAGRYGLVRFDGKGSVEVSGDCILEWYSAYSVHADLAVHRHNRHCSCDYSIHIVG
jgi:hypothetical protein